ncbi:MAG: phosphotransferase [Patescibacteria group bacterium]
MENPFSSEASHDAARESTPPSSVKPDSTKRLRELAMTPERLLEQDVRQEVEERLRDMMQPALKIGEGQVADVYAGREGNGMGGFCIKHKARLTPETALDNELQVEMQLQERAYRILEDARVKGLSVARVPQPWVYIKTSKGEEILSMDRVPGKTLRRLMLERVVQNVPDKDILPGYRREMLKDAHDDDLEEMVLNRFLKAGAKSTAEMHQALVSQAGSPPFLSTELALQIRNTLQTLNRNGLYHRDLHAKNIMISDDLTQAYLIDFGRASYGEHTSMDEATDVERAGTKVRYLRDEGILSTISKLIPKPVKKA